MVATKDHISDKAYYFSCYISQTKDGKRKIKIYSLTNCHVLFYRFLPAHQVFYLEQ